MKSRTFFALTLGICGLLAGAAVLAGPLDPPAGPIGPTMKALDQVEPRTPITQTTAPGNTASVFVISQPGSYYLPADVVVPSGRSGITVTAPDVTIDLCGFMIKGQAASLSGVTTTFDAGRLVLRNGRVEGLGGDGINAGGSRGSALDNLIVTFCGGNGIVTGSNSTADRCTAEGCTLNGFLLGMGSVVRDCIAAENTLSGVRMQGISQVLTTTARENRESGIYSAGVGNLVRQCTVVANIADGISVVGSGAAIIANYCTGNGFTDSHGGGITGHLSSTGSAIIDNIVIGNDYGVHVVSSGNLVSRTRAGSNQASLNITGGNAVGPTVNATTMLTNTNPDANCVY